MHFDQKGCASDFIFHSSKVLEYFYCVIMGVTSIHGNGMWLSLCLSHSPAVESLPRSKRVKRNENINKKCPQRDTWKYLPEKYQKTEIRYWDGVGNGFLVFSSFPRVRTQIAEGLCVASPIMVATSEQLALSHSFVFSSFFLPQRVQPKNSLRPRIMKWFIP